MIVCGCVYVVACVNAFFLESEFACVCVCV